MTPPLSDRLLRDLMAAGQTDVLVALPTQNHAKTAGLVAGAVARAFAGPLVRERTVLLNLDGGSQDGTPDVIRDAADQNLVAAQYALRTIHRITAPYHGVPGRSTAVRLALIAAELLRARAVLVVDPTAHLITAEDIAGFVRAVLSSGADYVKPALPRAPSDGPLITQLVRPLFRAAYGRRLLEPIDTQLACSGRFGSAAVAASFWGDPHAEIGVDAFLTAHALRGGFTLRQVATQARAHADHEHRATTHDVFRQVVDSVFASLAPHSATWGMVRGSEDIATDGALGSPPPAPVFNRDSLHAQFRAGVQALDPLLASVLDRPTREQLVATAHGAIGVDVRIWARVVVAFLRAAASGASSSDQLAQMLEPVYLGRVAGLLCEVDRPGQDILESVAVAFEDEKAAAFGRSVEGEGHHG